MNIAVASDAHGATRMMDAMLAALPQRDIGMLCFLGDMDKDALYLDWGVRELCPGAVFHAVAGNNDPFSDRARAEVLALEGVRCLLTHGHMYPRVRATRQFMAQQAARLDVRLVLYGHTHAAMDETIDGIRLINPGALLQGEWLLLRVRGGEIDPAWQDCAR